MGLVSVQADCNIVEHHEESVGPRTAGSSALETAGMNVAAVPVFFVI